MRRYFKDFSKELDKFFKNWEREQDGNIQLRENRTCRRGGRQKGVAEARYKADCMNGITTKIIEKVSFPCYFLGTAKK